MSSYVFSWVLAESESGGNDRLVMLALANETNSDGWGTATKARLAQGAKCSESTVWRCLDRLVESGELTEETDESRAPSWWRGISKNRRPRLFLFVLYVPSPFNPDSKKLPASQGLQNDTPHKVPVSPKEDDEGDFGVAQGSRRGRAGVAQGSRRGRAGVAPGRDASLVPNPEEIKTSTDAFTSSLPCDFPPAASNPKTSSRARTDSPRSVTAERNILAKRITDEYFARVKRETKHSPCEGFMPINRIVAWALGDGYEPDRITAVLKTWETAAPRRPPFTKQTLKERLDGPQAPNGSKPSGGPPGPHDWIAAREAAWGPVASLDEQ